MVILSCVTFLPDERCGNFTLRGEHKLMVFENRVRRIIFGPKREEVTGKLHNEKLHNLYSLSNIVRMNKSRRMKLAGETGNNYKTVIGKP
jgi:hypothetical protein